ncbi:MAG TPA: hypothetical protein VG498_25950 [Terriglobales bacterium]|nr:hypothetical protein [Terriglobales bacterium]
MCSRRFPIEKPMTLGTSKFPSAAAAIMWGGLMCGVFDIVYAFLFFGAFGARPLRILQSISSGLLGRAAFDGGFKTAILGLFLHFVISFGAATVYYVASRKLDFMIRNAVRSGLAYGVAVYLFMNYVVIPLSAVRKQPFNGKMFVINLVEHMLLVGLPIALATRRFAGPGGSGWKKPLEPPQMGKARSA